MYSAAACRLSSRPWTAPRVSSWRSQRTRNWVTVNKGGLESHWKLARPAPIGLTPSHPFQRGPPRLICYFRHLCDTHVTANIFTITIWCVFLGESQDVRKSAYSFNRTFQLIVTNNSNNINNTFFSQYYTVCFIILYSVILICPRVMCVFIFYVVL